MSAAWRLPISTPFEAMTSRQLCSARYEAYAERIKYYTLLKHATGAGHLKIMASAYMEIEGYAIHT